MQGGLQVRGQDDEERVSGRRPAHHPPGAQQHRRRGRPGAAGRVGRPLPLPFPELRGLRQPRPQPQRHQSQGKGQQERQPPAPATQLGLGQHGGRRRRDPRPAQQAQRHRERLPRAVQPAPSRRGELRQQGNRPAELTTGREPLESSQKRQQPGCQGAGRGVRRQRTDQCRRGRHQRDHHEQHRPPPDPVAQPAEQGSAERPEEERQRERGVRAHQCLGRVPARRGEEPVCEHRGQIAVDTELVPLDEVAHRPRRHRPHRRCADGLTAAGGALVAVVAVVSPVFENQLHSTPC